MLRAESRPLFRQQLSRGQARQFRHRLRPVIIEMEFNWAVDRAESSLLFQFLKGRSSRSIIHRKVNQGLPER